MTFAKQGAIIITMLFNVVNMISVGRGPDCYGYPIEKIALWISNFTWYYKQNRQIAFNFSTTVFKQ